MRWRFTAAAGLAFVALLAWVLTQERGRVPEQDEVFKLDAALATKLEVKRKDEKDTVIQKRDDDWYLLKPIAGLADTDEVERMVKAVAELKPTGTRKGLDLNSDDFALKKPDLTATLWYGGKSVQISLGGETPVGSDRYAKIRGRKELFIVGSSLRTSLWKDAEKLREKQLAKFEKENVTRLDLRHDQTRIVCVAKPGEGEEVEWSLTEPLKTAGDDWNIKQLIGKVKDLQAEDFLDEKKSDKDLGLDKPQVRVGLDLKDGRKLTVSIGKKSKQKVGDNDEEKDVLFARSSERKEILLVKTDVLDGLTKSLLDLRDKSVVQFQRDDVTDIKVERGEGMSFALARRPTGWRVVTPEKVDAKEDAVNSLLWSLEDLDARKFVKEEAKREDLRQYGLVSPDTVITVKLRGQAKDLMVYIGYQDSEGDYYCMTSQSAQVVTISDFLIKDLPEDIDDLKKSPTDMTPEAPFDLEPETED